MSSTPAGSLIVEFFGIPRERAGRTELTVAAGSLKDVLGAIQEQCARWKDLREPDGSLSRHYRISLNGQRFLTDDREILAQGSHLLLLSADAGG